ncbi:MAG: nucleotidyltransferase domain-containing protein [Paramuribaculum sp.]|nr:nucleotidyltransferase domain-containing protein [Paramuribaculum sp.]
MKLIEMNIEQIKALCKKYKVSKLWVFGSILTPRFNEHSDVDFSVSFDKSKIDLLDYADNYFDFADALKALFCREIDLVCDDSVKNRFFRKELDATKILIYG